jgi:pimeloyl-ACP methyl ester carboxylesterase
MRLVMPGKYKPMPMRILLVFLVLSRLPSLATSQTNTQTTVEAKPQEIEIAFQSGDVTLSGTLLLPESSAPVPAIVLTHGSGSATREEGRPFAERFVHDGLAALIFDKRGCGASGGSWTAASLDDLADDAIAAAAFLTSRSKVDVSQSGWVIPHAIARSPGTFAFSVIVTGGGVRPLEVERYDYNEALEEIQATAEEKRDAMALVTRYFEYLKGGEGRAELESSIAAAAGKRWGKAVDLSHVMPSAQTRKKWEWVPTYDPQGDIARLNIPVLVVLGGRDRPGLAEIAEERWLASLHKAGNSDATVLVFIAAGHGITTGAHHLDVRSITYAAGYFELIDAWLRVHCAVH